MNFKVSIKLGSEHQRGIALLPVVFTLAILGAAAFLASREGMVALSVTRSEAVKAANDVAANSVMERAKWALMHNNCSVPANVTGAQYNDATFDVSYTGTLPDVSIETTLHSADGTHTERISQPLKVYDYLQPRQVTLQPNAGDSEDTYIEGESGHQDHNKGGDNELKLESQSNKKKRILLKFDLDSLPENIALSSASLELYQNSDSGSARTIGVYRVTREWDEMEVTWDERDDDDDWDNGGGDYDRAVAGSFVASASNVWRSVAITELTNYWLDSPDNNHGAMLLSASTSTSNEKRFRASSHNEANLRPKLTLTYLCECGQTCNAGDVVQDIKLSANSKAELNDVTFMPSDIFWDRGADTESTVLFDGTSLLGSNKISAFHQLANNNYALSFQSAVSLNGLSIQPNDIVEFNPNTQVAYMRFRGSDHNFNSDINSLHVDEFGHLTFSTNASGSLYGQNFNDKDLLIFKRTSMEAGLALKESDHGYERRITAVHQTSDGKFVLAFENNVDWDGEDYTRGSLMEYDPVSTDKLVYFDGSRFGDSNSITSTHIGPPSGAFPALEIAHWEFTDELEEPALDSINDLPASKYAEPAKPDWVPGGNNGSMRFDGVDDGMTVADNDLLDFSSEFTISAYVYLSAAIAGKNWAIASKESSSRNNGYAMLLDGEKLVLRLQGNWYSANAKSISAGRWHHLAVVYDGLRGQVRLFLDGALLMQHVSSALPGLNNEPLRIGHSAGNEFAPGVIDDLKLYREALDLSSIQELYSGLPELPPDTAPEAPAGGDGGAGDSGGDDDSSSPGDAAWACNGIYQDNFLTPDPTASDGSINWSPFPAYKNESLYWNSWLADIRILNGYMRMQDSGMVYVRRVDLSGAKQAFLNYDFKRVGVEETNEIVRVFVNTLPNPNDGPWTLVAQHAGGVEDVQWQSHSIPLGDYISKTTWFLFETSATYTDNDDFLIDYVSVSCATEPQLTAAP